MTASPSQRLLKSLIAIPFSHSVGSAIIQQNSQWTPSMPRKMINAIIALTLLLVLSACTYNPFVRDNQTTGSPTGTAIGAAAGTGGMAILGAPKPLLVLGGIGGGMLGYYLTTLRHDASAIIKANGQVYQVGDFVGIYIPTDRLFEPNTDDFIPDAKPILDSAVTVLQRYPNNNIIISGNTSGFYRAKWEVRLSEKRAQKVASYFWNAGIVNDGFREESMELNDTKYQYVGYGDYFPIAQTYTNEGIRQNSRIQIVSYPTTCHLRRYKAENTGSLDDNTPKVRCCSAGGC